MTENQALFDYVLSLADDRLILGQRLGEWCGHGPILEEDIALTNISLDCFGQAKLFLEYASSIDSKKRSADQLAFLRDTSDFKNIQLVEQPNSDFAVTIIRQFLFDVYSNYLYESLSKSTNTNLAAIAAKSIKEVKYHRRHSQNWVIMLGDGTEESHQKVQLALDILWPFTNEFFKPSEFELLLIENNIAANCLDFKEQWQTDVNSVFSEATLSIPENSQYIVDGGRFGNHTEHLDLLLNDMQYLQRTYPGAKW